MLTHCVFFWLREGLSPEQHQAFREGLETLRGIGTVKALYIGTPAPTPPRPIIDASYTFGLAVVFEDRTGHDIYQTHPLHQAFLKNFSPCWTKVQIYDFD